MTKDPRAEPDSTEAPEPLKPEAPTRNTLVPAFDVETFARAVDGSQQRAPVVTVTNEMELEAARQASMKSSLPPARARARSEAELELSTADVMIEDLSPVVIQTPPGQIAPMLAEPRMDPELLLEDLRQVPRLLVSPDAVPGLGLDHHAGFLLALVDSVLSYDTILDVCGMPRQEALTVLAQLVARNIIGT